ncbi:protein cereblon-like [Clytia hemisphaerica]|uniref:Protein cereblon n=1 Tax=Clytia hemisphaerica TaxID=252671 RepID=A0A7M5VCB5_9CNID|eukprot:TCONS_00018262-protein
MDMNEMESESESVLSMENDENIALNEEADNEDEEEVIENENEENEDNNIENVIEYGIENVIELDDFDDGDEEDGDDGDVVGVADVLAFLQQYIAGDEDEGGSSEESDSDDMEYHSANSDSDHEDEREENEEGEQSQNSETTFDTNLPTSHSYLGDDLEILHGRTIHVEGDLVSLPLYNISGIVLIPGQILPLNISHPTAVAMMKRVVSADKTFGFLIDKPGSTTTRGDHSNNREFASVGVTCEVLSMKEEERYGLTRLLLKAEGRQRFKLITIQSQLDGVMLGKIRILPDAYISPQPRASLVYAQHYPQCNAIRGQLVANQFHLNEEKLSSNQNRYLVGFNLKHAQLLCTSLTSIQGWTYKLYNPYFLMDCLLHEIRSWNQNLDFDNIPQNPIEFSFWITKNLPLTNEMKVELLEIDSAPLRLRKQIHFMNKFGSGLACERCKSLITDKDELFSLSKRGPMGAFVNPGGVIHETLTFYKANHLRLQGRATTEYSWFPGYAWTIAICKTCHRHMGWKFTATKKELKPKKFWGLVRAALKPIFKESRDKEEADERPARRTFSSEGLGDNRNIQYESSI